MKKKIDKNCPEHGYTGKAKDNFWKHPYTSHWYCSCKK